MIRQQLFCVAIFSCAALVAQPLYANSATESCLQRDKSGDFMGWADYPHCLVDSRTQSTVRWLDDWFGDPAHDEVAKAYLRAITDFRVTDQGDVTAAIRLRAKLALPKLNRRLSLIFEDERPESDSVRQLSNENDSALSLRYLLKSLERFRLDADLGVRSGPDVFARIRYRQSWALSADDQIRVSQTLRYGVKEKVRAINQIDYSHAFSEQGVGMAYHNVDYQQEEFDRGLLWGRGVLYAHSLKSHGAWSAGVGQEGVSKPKWQEESRFVWMRYRQRFMRDWLFYEVEPRLTQQRELSWKNEASITLRLEVQFGYDYAQTPVPQTAQLSAYLDK
ncbi:MAG: hypothetical protein U0998_06515 [Moraxellaceae bacterium]|nr:hypothetical protein [Moraxellaceae bacterium]MDZ4386854.1 hypothetical protein [Moraxellaceae bacterium]